MSGFGVIHDVSLELRRQVFTVLSATPGTDFFLDDEGTNITFSAPGDDLPEGTMASLYLYHLDVDKHLRNQRPLPDRSAADLFHRPPLPLQLRYLFTPVGDQEDNNHLLLGRVLQHFHDAPSFATLSGEPVGDSRGGASPELRVRTEMLSLEQLAQIWNALSTPYRLSLPLLIEIVAVDSAAPPRRTPRVETLVPALGKAEAL